MNKKDKWMFIAGWSIMIIMGGAMIIAMQTINFLVANLIAK
jgi:hypothetical protein